ncbi:MAG: hypothetical protein Q4E75_03555 [bacterium]|nr:hypothetical protein [bacterium]
MESIKFAFKICIDNLFPAIIPFMLMSDILISYNYIEDISTILNKIMIKLFKVSPSASFIFIMSIFSGSPSNAKYINDLLNSNMITIKDGQNCLNFCHFTNPIFILGTIGYTYLQDKRLGLIILISHFTGSIIIGLFNKNNNIYYNYYIKTNDKKSFINILKQSISKTVDTLFLILGVITSFIILTNIIDLIFKIPTNFKFIYGILEISQGLKYLSLANLNIKIKAIIAQGLISFGGICVHMQVFSIINNKKIRYKPYLKARIIHMIISSIITYLIINLLY